MTKTKMAAIAMLAIWPLAMLLGYRTPLLHMALGATLFLWMMEFFERKPIKVKRRPAPRYG